jgi:3-hydroxymyristoyl/3-hydroxydecanoyl-(acyl carrier protein) dehydratase
VSKPVDVVETVERQFERDLKSAQGHFPGNPIIPGAVLLSETLIAIEAVTGVPLAACHVRAAKFFRPVRPGARARIEFTRLAPDAIRFTCLVDEQTVLSGVVECAALATPA